MKNKLTLRELTQLAVLTALTVATGFVLNVPNPLTKGVFVLIDWGILVAGILFGAMGGGIVGGLSGFLYDMLGGYPTWAIFSLVIHGAQGYVFGQLYRKSKPLAYGVSSVLMVVGYFFADWMMSGEAAAFASIMSNSAQVGISAIVVLLFEPVLTQLRKPWVSRALRTR